jgi:hypothetical protein
MDCNNSKRLSIRGGLVILIGRNFVSLMGAAMALTTVASSIIATSIPLMVEPNLPR